MKLVLSNKNIESFLKKINYGILKKVFFFASIIYLFYCLKKNIISISLGFDFNIFKLYILFSFTFCIFSILFNAIAWKYIITWLGFKKKSLEIINFYILTNSLKYIPGGIWHFFERFNYLKKITDRYLSLYSILLEPYMMLSASFLIVSLGIFFSPLFIFFTLPTIFLNKYLIKNVLLKLESLQKKSIRFLNIQSSNLDFCSKVKLNSLFPLKALLFEILFIFSKYLSFLICFGIFNENIFEKSFIVLIFFCLSWSVGLIIPAAPGGLGVFEACFIFLTAKYFTQSSTIESLIYFRIISTIADLSLSAPFLLKKSLKKI
tara:strand:+ start:461 stop:1417 length:957 start_codon:yes stop_codon:yes gene_type:complete